MDDEQTVYDISGRREDGYQIIEFSRKRDTQDPNGQNYVFGDQKCPFFIFPIVGGSYDSFGGIQAHSQKAKPKISPQRICVRSCNIGIHISSINVLTRRNIFVHSRNQSINQLIDRLTYII